MPILFLIIPIVIIVILLAGAMFFGMIGAVRSGPKPSEGSKDVG
jgi:hypothetical protein